MLTQPKSHDAARQARATQLRDALDKAHPDAPREIQDELSRHRFYHFVDVAPGIATSGAHDWTRIFVNHFRQAAARLDFRGKRVLDVGCRDGAMLFIAEEAGASELGRVLINLSQRLLRSNTDRFVQSQ